ncbi:tripartite motif-containing protein 16-like [Labrus bergylta]|uniref:tripartite motif-containing protein 16-like n=1 Tax=Labrus bergylta TaxID=56723 RepID=UPI003313EA05
MAQQGNQSGQCSICFNTANDPVTTSCEHSYCTSCIRGFSEEENQMENYSCPKCREVFVPGPVLEKNTDLLEQLNEAGCGVSSGPADMTYDRKSDARDNQESLIEDRAKMFAETNTSLQEEEPKTRAEFLKYSCKITLDPNTVNSGLLLSEGNRKATKMEEDQVYPSHPDRFVYGRQVMSKESLSGRHYFEVERSGGSLSIAVSYKDISRTGTESIFGFNEGSWALDCVDGRFIVRHVYITAAKPHLMSSRVGVYLDHSAGILSFYDVYNTMTLLHRVQTTFTQPLHVGLWVFGIKTVALMCYELQDDQDN